MEFDSKTTNLIALSSARSALAYAVTCLERCSERHEELEQHLEAALRLSARKELECSLIRDLSRCRDRLGLTVNENGSSWQESPHKIPAPK